jgi:RNase P/RNase MRP subunit p30
MFDILRYNTNIDPKEYGFEAFYSLDSIGRKIKKAKNLQEAVAYRNKKALLVLEDYAINEGAIKLIGEKNEACFVIDLSRIIKNSGLQRALELNRLRNFLKYCIKYKAKYALASFISEEHKIRTARELIHISLLLGLDIGKAKEALTRIKDYLL